MSFRVLFNFRDILTVALRNGRHKATGLERDKILFIDVLACPLCRVSFFSAPTRSSEDLPDVKGVHLRIHILIEQSILSQTCEIGRIALHIVRLFAPGRWCLKDTVIDFVEVSSILRNSKDLYL